MACLEYSDIIKNMTSLKYQSEFQNSVTSWIIHKRVTHSKYIKNLIIVDGFGN